MELTTASAPIVTASLACPRHGMLTDRDAAACPTCAGPVYDLDVPVELADALAATRLIGPSVVVLGGSMALAFLTPLILHLGFDVRVSPNLGYLLLGPSYLLARAVSRFFRTPARRDFDDRLAAERRRLAGTASRPGPYRLLTSTPLIVSGLLLLAFALEAQDPGTAMRVFALVPAEVWNGRLAGLVTCAFLHASFMHLLLNVFGLLGFGIFVDHRVGRLRAAALLLGGVLVGSLAHLFVNAQSGVPCVGISAGVYALMGAALVLAPHRTWVLVFRGVALKLPAYVGLPLVFIVSLGLDLVLRTNVAWDAHVGGVCVGLLAGVLLRRIPEPEWFTVRESKREARLEASAVF